MPDGTEPIPDATPEDAAKAAQVRDELAGIQGDPAVNDAGAVGFDEAAKQANFDQYREKQTSERQPAAPLTPEQQRLIDAREQAIEYANRRLDLTGVDGKPLPTDAALQLIRSVQEEATYILESEAIKGLRGEPRDEAALEKGLLLSLIANSAEYRTVKQDNDLAEAIAKIHGANPLTDTGALEKLFGSKPTRRIDEENGTKPPGENPEPLLYPKDQTKVNP